MIQYLKALAGALLLCVSYATSAVAVDISMSVLDRLKAAGVPIILANAKGTGDCWDSVRRCYNACYQEVSAAGGASHTGSAETSPCWASCDALYNTQGDSPGYHSYCSGASPQIHTVGDCTDSVWRCHVAISDAIQNAGGTVYNGPYETSPVRAGCAAQFDPQNDVPGSHAQCTGR